MAALPSPGADPNSPPPDQMLDVHGGDPNDPNEAQEPQESAGPSYGVMPGQDPEAVEVEHIEKVELCLLNAIESCATAVETGVGASNPEFAQQFGQAAQSLALAFQALSSNEPGEGSQSATGKPPVGNS